MFQAAKQLGYVPNRLARGIKSRSNLIGILMSDFENPAYLPLLDYFTFNIQQRQCRSMLLNIGSDMDTEQAVDLMTSYRIDGIVVISSHLPSEIVNDCKEKGLPIVSFCRPLKNEETTAVYCDNISGGQMAADLLYDLGYKFPCFIGGPLAATSTVDRQRGFISRLIDLGMKQWLTIEGGAYSYDAGYQATLKLFDSGNQPDAFFYADDIMACGGMDALRYELNLKIPDDVGVIGVDDIRLARSKSYSLTTISQPFSAMVEETINLLFELIEEDDAEFGKHRVLPCELIQRDSTRQVNK